MNVGLDDVSIQDDDEEIIIDGSQFGPIPEDVFNIDPINDQEALNPLAAVDVEEELELAAVEEVEEELAVVVEPTVEELELALLRRYIAETEDLNKQMDDLKKHMNDLKK